ncbi:unnamed protein product [Rotaria sp. Silwood1]|nr:unnamed protein product [Rotaria sp. Silwood1]
MLDIQVALRLEDQMLTLLNMTTEEYDQILDDEHTKLLQTQQFPSESHFIWNNIASENLRYAQTIKEIREELDITQRHRRGLEEKLEMIVIKENEELKNRKVTGIFTANEAAQQTGKISNPLQGLEHAFESAGRKTDLVGYAPQERILSRFSYMLESSNNGRAWTDFDLASYCDSCADKTYLCPHKFAEAQMIVKVPDGTKYIRISRPTLKYNEALIRIIASLPVDDMVWFVFQVLRSSETEFNKTERKEILERMTQIFSFELDPFAMLLNNIWIDYFAILKNSSGIEQRLLITWLYGINGKQSLNNSFLLSLQQYIQWHWLESESIHLLLGILLRQYDRHGENLCTLNDFSLFFFRLLFPSFKIDGYVTEKLNDIDANRTFNYSEIIINHLQCLKIHRDNIIESLWIRIENAFAINKMKQLKWFEWTTIYSLISIDNEIFPDAIVQSRIAVHLIQTIQQMNHISNQQMHQFILTRLRTSPALKRLLKECLTLTGNDPELHARCISLLD